MKPVARTSSALRHNRKMKRREARLDARSEYHRMQREDTERKRPHHLKRQQPNEFGLFAKILIVGTIMLIGWYYIGPRPTMEMWYRSTWR